MKSNVDDVQIATNILASGNSSDINDSGEATKRHRPPRSQGLSATHVLPHKRFHSVLNTSSPCYHQLRTLNAALRHLPGGSARCMFTVKFSQVLPRTMMADPACGSIAVDYYKSVQGWRALSRDHVSITAVQQHQHSA